MPGEDGTVMLQLQGVTRTFNLAGVELHVLRGVDLTAHEGDFISILGPSGCGKSTLLNILGLLDSPTSGRYLLEGQEVAGLDDSDLSSLRNRKIGFVFQSFNLLPRLNARENIEMPLVYRGTSTQERRERASELLETVGLGDRCDHLPAQLSGGQQQRVAIARALVSDPVVLLADEPTGALDTKVGRQIMELFIQLNSDHNLTIAMITHDLELAKQGSVRLAMRDGLLGKA
jgi:putative ABC transport system ATP-binding protein